MKDSPYGPKFDNGIRVSVQARFFLDADLTHLAHVTDLELMSGVGLTDAGLACLKKRPSLGSVGLHKDHRGGYCPS